MRLRKKPWIAEALRQYSDIVIQSEAGYSGAWRSLSGYGSLHVEIGTGRGQFIATMAEQNPDILFVGIEASQDVLYDAARKVREKQLQNVRLAVFDAVRLLELFAPGEVDRLYINFCDPWPKNRHAKRRLTNPLFLAKYRIIMAPHGRLWFKTDNASLFEFSLNQFADSGLQLANIALDLHKSGFAGNVMTEYEAKFAQRGMKIYRCEVIFG